MRGRKMQLAIYVTHHTGMRVTTQTTRTFTTIESNLFTVNFTIEEEAA